MSKPEKLFNEIIELIIDRLQKTNDDKNVDNKDVLLLMLVMQNKHLINKLNNNDCLGDNFLPIKCPSKKKK